MNTQIYSLSGGEISRRLWSRSDMPRYFASVASLRNFFCSSYGGITRRPGLEHISIFDTTGIRLVPFRYSAATAFVLAFGNSKMRFYSNGAEVQVDGDPLELVTPWAASKLGELRTAQLLDEVISVHPTLPPWKLFRQADDDWTLNEWALAYPPFMDANEDDTLTVTPSATTGTVTLTASAALWNANHVGAYWRIGHIRTTNAQAKAIDSTGATTSMLISGVYTIRTTGTWSATVRLEASKDGTNWEVLKSWVGVNDLNLEHRGTIDEPLWIRANVSAYTSNTDGRMVIEADESLIWGYAKITHVTDSTHVTATVVETLQSTAATSYWQEGSWSPNNGYPSQVAFHDGRLFFASTKREPLKYWASRVDQHNDFRPLAWNPSYAIEEQLYSATADKIQWMTSRNGALIIGTAGDEWIVKNASGPDTASAQRATAYGSAAIQAVELNDSLLFVQRRGRKMRDYIGLDAQSGLVRDPYSAGELTLVAEHVTRSGIVQLAVSQQPDSVIWAVMGEGSLCGLTYERNLEVMGWHIHETDGTIESVATIPGSYGDEVWVAVLRDGTRRIERFHPPTIEAAIYADRFGYMFCDAGKLIVMEEPGTVVTGLSHLNGKTVSVLLDGGEHPDCVVTDGAITLAREGSVVAVGLPFTSLVETLPLVAQTQQGSTRYQIGRISTVLVDQHNTFGLEYSDADREKWYAVSHRTDGDNPLLPPALKIGPSQITLAGKHDRLPRLKLRQKTPMPATILSLSCTWERTES